MSAFEQMKRRLESLSVPAHKIPDSCLEKWILQEGYIFACWESEEDHEMPFYQPSSMLIKPTSTMAELLGFINLSRVNRD